MDEDDDLPPELWGSPRGSGWGLFITIAGLGVIAVVLFFLAMTTESDAHESHGGMPYDAICCSGNATSGDCQEIPDSAVKPIPGGYQITIRPGDHRLATRVHMFQRAQSDTRKSTDGKFHLCLYPSEDNVQCFYAPPFGM